MSEWWSTAGGVQSALREEIKTRDDRIEKLEAKLAKAVGHLEKLDRLTARHAALIQAALAELKGQDDE